MEEETRSEDALSVSRILLTNYRRFITIDLQPSALNVIVGVNGSGKSTLLQGLAVGFSRLTSRIVNGRSAGIRIAQSDIHSGSSTCAIELIVKRSPLIFLNSLIQVRKGHLPASSFNERFPDTEIRASDEKSTSFATLADSYRGRLTRDDRASLPVIALYPVNRAVLDIPIRIKTKHTFDQVDAYEGAFDTQRNFRTFFEWFRDREDLENEERIDRSEFRDPQLQAVRQAVEGMMDGYRDLRVRRNPLRMTLKKNDEELLVNQLSDGEKALLALVGDLARRMAIANPGLDNPLEGEGIVMIDEVDLHLHPSWQRKVVQRLPKTFPNVQFFLTTHSPVVASAVRPESLWVLREGEIKHAEAYGADVGLVLSEVFDTPPRLEEVRRDLDALFLAIHRGDADEAQRRLTELEETIGPSDPELIQARVMMRGYATV